MGRIYHLMGRAACVWNAADAKFQYCVDRVFNRDAMQLEALVRAEMQTANQKIGGQSQKWYLANEDLTPFLSEMSVERKGRKVSVVFAEGVKVEVTRSEGKFYYLLGQKEKETKWDHTPLSDFVGTVLGVCNRLRVPPEPAKTTATKPATEPVLLSPETA